MLKVLLLVLLKMLLVVEQRKKTTMLGVEKRFQVSVTITLHAGPIEPLLKDNPSQIEKCVY